MKVLAVILMLASAALAQVGQMKVQYGGSVVTITLDGQVSYSNPCIDCSVSGLIVHEPGFLSVGLITVGAFTFADVNAVSKPAVFDEVVVQADVYNDGQADGTADITMSDTGFTAIQHTLKGDELACEGFSMLGDGLGTVSCAGYTDDSNALFAETRQVGFLGPFMGYFSQEVAYGPGATRAPYSMTVTGHFFVPQHGEAGGGFILYAPGSSIN